MRTHHFGSSKKKGFFGGEMRDFSFHLGGEENEERKKLLQSKTHFALHGKYTNCHYEVREKSEQKKYSHICQVMFRERNEEILK
jgi:hypothetical protein